MKPCILVLINLVFLCCATPKKMGKINSMFILNYFEPRGYTTSGAYTHFDDMIKQNINKINLNQDDCSHFNNIIKNIKPKKHFQTKFGGGLIFAEALVDNRSTRIIVASDNLIVDLTNNCTYKLSTKSFILFILNKLLGKS
jgi:hypothetical protein